MSLAERCDEIVRLIDEGLRATSGTPRAAHSKEPTVRPVRSDDDGSDGNRLDGNRLDGNRLDGDGQSYEQWRHPAGPGVRAGGPDVAA